MTLYRGIAERLRSTGHEEGQALTEYPLILIFIAVVAVIAVTAFGRQVAALFDSVAGAF